MNLAHRLAVTSLKGKSPFWESEWPAEGKNFSQFDETLCSAQTTIAIQLSNLFILRGLRPVRDLDIGRPADDKR
jgi:hypothetical protein